MQSKLVTIASSDKDPTESTTNSDFVVYLKEKYTTQEIKYIMVRDVQVPNVFYNIRSSNGTPNNEFKFTQTGQATQLVTIPEGQYNLATFITALQAAINAALVGATVSITQNPLTQRLIFTFTAATAIIYDIEDGNSMGNAAGITTTNIIPVAVINAQSLPDLSGIRMVYVHSIDLARSNTIDGSFGLISMAECINLADTPFGNTAYKQSNDSELASILYADKRNINRIGIVLRDEDGNRLDIGTSQMTVVLKIFYD
jgi:hypothetical protein